MHSIFPIEIKNYFLKHPFESHNESQALLDILANDSVKETFIAWSRVHQSVVEYTPRLYKVLDLATDSSIEWDNVAKLVHSVYLWFSDDGTLILIKHFLTGMQPLFFPDNYTQRTLELYESGVIDLNNLVALFSFKKQNGYCPLHDALTFKKNLPHLEKLDTKTLMALISIKNQRGINPLLCDPILFKTALPLLKKLDSYQIVTIFSSTDRDEDCPLHNLSIFKEAFPLFKNLNIHELIEIFSIKDMFGHSLLHSSTKFEEAFPFLKNLDIQELILVLSIKDKLGLSLLHNIFIFKKVLPLFENLNIQEFISIFSMQSILGETLLECHFSEIITINLLENLNSGDLVSLFSIKNKNGDCPLYKFESFKKVFHLFEKLSIKQLCTVLSIKNQKGDCPLDNPEIFRKVFHLLDNFPNESALYEFLSLKNNESNFLHSKKSNLTSLIMDQEQLNQINSKESIFQLIAEDILKTPGFITVKGDTWKHKKNINSETFSESQGGYTICQKVADFGIRAFKALSLNVLASKRHVNPSLYYILLMKRLSHALSLKGPITLPNGSIRHVEGFDESFTVPMLSHTFLNFLSKQESGYSIKRQAWMKNVLTAAIWHQNASDEHLDDVYKILQSSIKSYPIIIGSGWDWHSIQIVFDEYDNFFFCNCGDDSIPGGEIIEFSIKDKTKLTPKFLKKLVIRSNVEKIEYINMNVLASELSAKEVRRYELPQQTAGTCTYTNMIAAMYVLLILWKRKDKCFRINESLSPQELHEHFINYDKEILLLQFIEELKYSSSKNEQTGHKLICVKEMKQLISDQFEQNKISNIKLNTRVTRLFDQIITFKSEGLVQKV